MSYYEPIEPTVPVDYFEQYDRYRYEDPRFPGAPLKEDWWWDLVAPTSDTQTYNRVKYTAPRPEDFSQDAFWAADPIIRGPLAEALSQAQGDSIGAYDYLNSPEVRDELLNQIGKTEWNQLRAAGILPEDNLPGDQLDQLALDYVLKGAENVLATGSPTLQRNAGIMDTLSERFGGRPYPGGELPGFEGAGFGNVGAEAQQQGGGQGQPAQGGNAGGGMPDMRTMQAIEDAVAKAPGLAEMPRNAYRAALEQRLRSGGYRRAGNDRSRNTRQYFRREAEKEGSRQRRRDAADVFGRGFRNMSSRNSGRREVRLNTNSRRRPSKPNSRTLASYYGR